MGQKPLKNEKVRPDMPLKLQKNKNKNNKKSKKWGKITNMPKKQIKILPETLKVRVIWWKK